MKETIRKIHDLQDLTDQFFCYTNKNGCQFIFSKYMLNIEGFEELREIRQIEKIFDQKLYLQRMEDLGCIGYMVTPHQSLGYDLLGKGWEEVFYNLNAELSKEYTILPNLESVLRESRKLSLRFLATSYMVDEFKLNANELEFPEPEKSSVEPSSDVRQEQANPWYRHPDAMIIGSSIILGLVCASHYFLSWSE